jgi:hypothetical protein
MLAHPRNEPSHPLSPPLCWPQWYEKWWEASDWRGMKEMGAEKWGCNARGEELLLPRSLHWRQ